MAEVNTGAAVSPLGMTATEARRRRAAQSPEYARAWERNAAARAIARQLIYYRMEHGLTQEELADRAGTSNTQISRLESGEHLPSITSLGKIANVLGLKLNVSFDRYEDAAPIAAN